MLRNAGTKDICTCSETSSPLSFWIFQWLFQIFPIHLKFPSTWIVCNCGKEGLPGKIETCLLSCASWHNYPSSGTSSNFSAISSLLPSLFSGILSFIFSFIPVLFPPWHDTHWLAAIHGTVQDAFFSFHSNLLSPLSILLQVPFLLCLNTLCNIVDESEFSSWVQWYWKWCEILLNVLKGTVRVLDLMQTGKDCFS